MSFTRLLAAGRSVMGIKKKPGPYRMNQDHLLPKFEPSPRSQPAVAPTKTLAAVKALAAIEQATAGDSDIEAAIMSPAAITDAANPFRTGSPDAENLDGEPCANRRLGDRIPEPGQNVLRRLVSRLNPWATRAERRSSPSASSRGRAVQSELSLDALKVVRNDLSDSEVQFVSGRRRAAFAAGKKGGASRRQPLGMVWNRLSARLLRQAVLEFNVTQKERGRIFSQAGHDGGSAGRP